MKSRFTFLFSAFTFLAVANGFSQTALRSIASGTWSAFATTWERTGNIYNPTPTWAAATAAPTTNQMAIIRSGHVVTIDVSGRNTKTIVVEAGGQLFASGAANSVRVGVPATGNGGSVDTVIIDGLLGGPGEIFPLEFGTGAASVWIRGTGSVEIGRIRPVNGNLNYLGSAAPNATTGLSVLIDRDIKLNTANNSVFSVTNTAPSANDSINYTILAGRTVTIANANSYFHNNNVTDGVVSAGGNYEYRIDGTLDLSANLSTLGGNSVIAYATATSGITLNVNGLLKLGGYFKADTVSNSLGALRLNINNGGLVDATLTSKLITGTIGAATATPNIFFKISGNGSLRRTVPADGTKVEFNIGTSLASYTPLTISGAGPAEVYTVTLKDAFTNPAPATSLAKEWNITEATAGGNATDTLRFQWTIADQTNGFTGTSPVFVRRWNGSAWSETLASVSGTGTAADPYVAKAAGFTAFGLFILSNAGTTPVAFVNEKAYQKQNGVQVEFGNATESDILNYVVEKSADGNKFTPVNTLSPKTNNGGLNSYAYFDATPNRGLNFYRIRATEKNGTVKYSNTLNIRLQTNGIWVNAYPNPVKGGNVNVQLENFEKSIYQVTITNQVGQTVYVKSINHNGGTATFKLDLPASVKKGMYSLQVSNTVTRVINKIVVE